MTQEQILRFLMTTVDGQEGLGAVGSRPTLKEAFAVYRDLLAAQRASQIAFVGELGDFSEVLRAVGKASLYSDEEWILFFRTLVRNDDRARGLWEGLVCQPEYGG